MSGSRKPDPARYEGVRYPGGRRGHVESYFLKINDPTGTRALWVKATIFAAQAKRGGEVLAESWAIAFDRESGRGHVAIKTTVPFGHAHFSRERLDVALPDLTMTRERVKGDLRRGDESLAFDLELTDPSQPLVHYPLARMYDGPFPSGKAMTPLPDLRASGEVRVRGETWDVRGWRGSLGHNWQSRHPVLYGWGHCNQWDQDDDVVFEGVSGRVRVGPATLPMMTVLLLRYHGVRYELNRLVDIPRIHAAVTFRRWEFSGANPMLSLRGELWSTPEDMVGLHYANPDGTMNYCLNSKLASARLEVTLRGRAPVTLTSRAAALEIGTRDPNHGVTMVL
jgi:hypothetical protein